MKVGDKVWVMNNNKPQEEEIGAKVTVDGKIDVSYSTIGEADGEGQVYYKVGYSMYPEEEVFETKEALQTSLFG